MRAGYKRFLRWSAFLPGAICYGIVGGAWAQIHGQALALQDAEFVFEEIVVTARKRDENLQSVPIAITTFSASELAEKNVQTLADLKFVTPSVQVQPDTFRQDTINITIRGIRNFPGNGVQYDTAAAVYVNGIYFARTQGLTGTLFDVDSVQVLKGPQGTLVGRNATGGAVLYTMREPQPHFEGSAQLVIGDYGRYEAQTIVNVPITERFFARASYSYTETGGYLRNAFFDPLTGERNDTPGLGARKTAGALALRFDPDDASKILLRMDFDYEHHTGSSYHLLDYFEGLNTSTGVIGSNPTPVVRPSICQIPTTCGTFMDLNGRLIAPYYSDVFTRTVNDAPEAYNALLNVLGRHQKDFWLIDQANSNYNTGAFHSISGNYDRRFGDVGLKVVGGYRWFSTLAQIDSRGAPYNNFDNTAHNPNYRAYTAEATVTGATLGATLDWTAGVFLFKENAGDQISTSYLLSTNQLRPQPIAGRQITGSDGTVTGGVNTAYAGYAQATYRIFPTFRITGGVRYSIDERSSNTRQSGVRFPATAATSAVVPNSVFDPGTIILNGISYTGITRTCGLTDLNGVPLAVANCHRAASDTFKEPTWTLSLDADIATGTLAYITARRGYKSGALNAAASNPALVVAQPEKVQDFEAGLKSDWFLSGMPWRTNFAAYLTNYADVQTQISLPDVVQATGPGGAGPCTQDLYNAGQCLGVQTTPITLNARKARVYGAEWDLSVRPLPAWTVSFNGSYLNAKYVDFSFAVPAGYLQPASGSSLAGKPFQLPSWTMAGSTTYRLTGEALGLPLERLSLTYNLYTQSNYRTDLTIYNPLQKVKGYALSGLRLNAENILGTRASFAASMTNLFNRRACLGEPGGMSGGSGVIGSTPNSTFGIPGTSGLTQCVPLPPRMLAATLRYTF
jgi:iron complex outermembrane receptor protein